MSPVSRRNQNKLNMEQNAGKQSKGQEDCCKSNKTNWNRSKNYIWKLGGGVFRTPKTPLATGLALHIWVHLASLREIEMVAVLCTNETTPMSFSLFLPPRGSLTPKRGEDTSRPRLHPHAKYGVNRPAGCWEIVDRTNKQTYSKQILRPSLYERMAGNKTVLSLRRRPSLQAFIIIF